MSAYFYLFSKIYNLLFPLSSVFRPSLYLFHIDIPPPLNRLLLSGAGPAKNIKKYLAPFGGLDGFVHLSPRPSGRRDVRGRGQRPQEGVDGQGHSGVPLSPVKSNYKLNIVYACCENLK